MNQTSLQYAKRYAELAEVLDIYLESQHDFSDAKLDRIFAPQAMVYANWEGGLVAWSLQEFKSMLKTIPNPHENGMALVGHVASLELLSGNTAMAVVEMQMYDDIYSDLLSFLRIDDRWSIYCKVFTKRSRTQAIRS
jgi:Putative lumazine-binding